MNVMTKVSDLSIQELQALIRETMLDALVKSQKTSI